MLFNSCYILLNTHLKEEWVGFQLLPYALDGKTEAEGNMTRLIEMFKIPLKKNPAGC